RNQGTPTHQAVSPSHPVTLSPCHLVTLSSPLADAVLARCEVVAGYTEEPGKTTRTFLCEPLHGLHARLGDWMRAAGMTVRLDPVGNLIGHYPAVRENAPVFLIGSHLDSVPDAGKFDGVLGVLLGVAAVQALGGKHLPFAVEVLGFSEEEGIRFRSPYLGSRAACGCFDDALLNRTDANGVSMAQAIGNFGLDAAQLGKAISPRGQALAYLEAHIEQGPVLDSRNLPLGIVTAIVGQSRFWLRFEGKAGHAGTLPMDQRRDGLAAAAEFVLEAERLARSHLDMRATVGCVAVVPGAVNVVPGSVSFTLDLRQPHDTLREQAGATLLAHAGTIAGRRGL